MSPLSSSPPNGQHQLQRFSCAVGYMPVLSLLKAPLKLTDQPFTADALGTIFEFSNTMLQIMSIAHTLLVLLLLRRRALLRYLSS